LTAVLGRSHFNVEFRQFEREFLRLAFTTDMELSAPALAFVTSIPITEAERHLATLVDMGTLELASDDDGHLKYAMPDRPTSPLRLDDPALVGHKHVTTHCIADRALLAQTPPRALVVRRMMPVSWEAKRPSAGQAVIAMFLNALVCPGAGSIVGGRTGVGAAQLAMFAVGLPLAVFTVGIPLMLVAWVWGMVTGAQLLSEARD